MYAIIFDRSSVFLFALFLVVVSSSAFAGDVRQPQPSQFLPDLNDSKELPCRYTGAFRQKRKMSGLDQSLGSMGKFLFDCELGLIWEIRQPVSNILVYTTRNVHYRVTSGGKVRPLDGKFQIRMAETLLDLLSGNTEALLNDFEIVESPLSKTAVANGDESISLIPNRSLARQFVQEMRLTASTVSLQVFIDSGESGATTIDIVNVRQFEAACEDFGSESGKACTLLSTPLTTTGQ